MFGLERVNNAWNNFVEELEKLGDEDANTVKQALKAAITVSPPDDVRDIPLGLNKANFEKLGETLSKGAITSRYGGFVVSQFGDVRAEEFYMPYKYECKLSARRRLFPTEEYAEDFYRLTQLIADCRHFKYLYDEDYVPDRTELYKKIWRVCYDYDLKAYSATWDDSRTDTGAVYFSSEYLAAKCAKWLN